VGVFVIQPEAAGVNGNLSHVPELLSTISVALIPASISTIVRPKSLGNVGPTEVSVAAKLRALGRCYMHPIPSAH
jgi:hypothetical protein